jgi:hypothetical protein
MLVLDRDGFFPDPIFPKFILKIRISDSDPIFSTCTVLMIKSWCIAH